MSEEQNIPEESSEKENLNPDSNRDENVNEHFPEDSHAQKTATSNIVPIAIATQTENLEVHKHPHHVTHKKK